MTSFVDQAFEEILALAKTVSCHVFVTDFLSPDDSDAYVVELDKDQFQAGISALKPGALYIQLETFSAKQMFLAGLKLKVDDMEPELAEHLSEENDDEDDRIDIKPTLAEHFAESKEAKAFVKKWSPRDNQHYGLNAFYVYETVIHHLSLQTEWAGSFWIGLHELAEALKVKRAEEVTAKRSEAHAKDSAELEEHARTLIANPLFNAPKTTKEKRLFLAERLFPDYESWYCQKIVAHAMNLLWFEAK